MSFSLKGIRNSLALKSIRQVGDEDSLEMME
jgi:hypothetical protein